MDSPVQELYEAMILKIIKIFDALKSPSWWLRYIINLFKKG